jgi:quinol monooxygenase YgiN
MYTLKIEHPVSSYDNWKIAFDNDPANRQKSGVIQYRIYRPVDNVNTVIIELDFESLQQTEAMLSSLRNLWSSVLGDIITNKPESKVYEQVESKKY